MSAVSEKERPATRRDEILNVAVELFDRQGFEKTTTDELAQAAGITKRTLYRHIHTKQQLLSDIHNRYLNDMEASVRALEGDPRSRFIQTVAAHIRMVGTRAREIKVFFEESKHLNEEQAEELALAQTRYESIVERSFADAVELGQFRALDSKFTTRAILGAVNEFYRWLRPDGRLSIERIIELVLELILQGIAVAPWSPDPDAVPSTERRLHSDRPIDKLVVAAARLFRERGYQRASTEDIAALSGVTKGALFYHAGTKEDLLVRIHESLISLSMESLAALDSTPMSVPDELNKVIENHCEMFRDFGDAFSVAVEELKFLPPAIQAESIAQRKGYGKRFRDLIVRGVEEGDLKTTDVDITAFTVLGMVNSTYRWYQPEGPLRPFDLANAYTDIILNGIDQK